MTNIPASSAAQVLDPIIAVEVDSREIGHPTRAIIRDSSMDRDEAIRLLKGGPDGVREWNQWRERDEEIPDLRCVYLSRTELGGVNLSEAILGGAILGGANLRGANLRGANLRGAYMISADLNGADLHGAELYMANLLRADLTGADLTGANLSVTNLSGADLTGAVCSWTVFTSLDFSEVRGLEAVDHHGPSSIGIDSLSRSGGKIPEVFLRGCGLTPWEILSANIYSPELTPPGLVELQRQILDAWTKGKSMINGCFVSYSWADAQFVEKLRDRLIAEGINVWLDRHDMVAGTIQDQVWRAIQDHHVVIIVLSEASVASDWVENELDMARQKEKAEKRAVLCPISLDDAWKAKVAAKDNPGDPSRPLWRTLQQKLVMDFHGWKTKAFEDSFQKLLRGLKTNYGPGASASP
jgi:hypothetical protein